MLVLCWCSVPSVHLFMDNLFAVWLVPRHVFRIGVLAYHLLLRSVLSVVDHVLTDGLETLKRVSAVTGC